MNELEFTASIVETMVWPIIVLIIIFILKNPLSHLILGLSKFKYNDLEMNFGKELSKLEKTIGGGKEHIDNNSMVVNRSDEENEILSIAEIHPSAAIIVTWAMVEKEIISTINRLSISPDYPPYNSALKNINLLKENRYIDTATYELITEFRVLRNKSAHLHNDGEKIKYLEAVKYYELAIKITKTLREIKR